MKKMLDDQEGTTTTQSTTSSTTKKRWSNDNEESIAQQQQQNHRPQQTQQKQQQQQAQQKHQHQRRRLRETSSRQRIPPPPKLQKDEWETEASGMEGEFMEYFLEQKGKKPKQTDGMGEKIRQQRLDEMKGNDIQQRIDNKYNNNPVYKSPKRMTQSSTDVNCENSNPRLGELPCPPNDLPQKCDKYNGGDFASCFNMCMESFCCIHDSKNVIARTCSKDLNCRHYAPCYIIWWKVQDTIGPRLIRTIQSDDFFNLPADNVVNSATDNGVPFILQVYEHHYDDDQFRDESYVLDPDNW
mmetsp:Transcript_25881/g.30498  ORF Transcript_25881/g.30498 Transcript_25881/m.30498 type:complete len:298 (+) Transcript_25881:1-894(+)